MIYLHQKFHGKKSNGGLAGHRGAELSAAAPQPATAMKPGGRSRQQGFTLLEVMIAMAIVGTTLIAMLSLGNRTISTNERLQRLTQATLLAQEKMTEVEQAAAADRTLDLQNAQGAFSEPFTDFLWQTSYTPTPVDQVQQVVVTVSWGEVKHNEMVDLTSFVFR